VLRAEEVKQKGEFKAWHNSTCEIRTRDVWEVIDQWEVERHPFVEAPSVEEEDQLEDVDSEAERLELEEEDLLDREECAIEERSELQLWHNVDAES
jgi:hypothetical protein